MGKINAGKNGSKKDVITRKASALFRKKGFSATSMRNIAESIGVEAPSLYNHIESKNDILKDICFNIAKLFTDFLKEVESDSGSNLSKIESIIRFHISMMIDQFEDVYISNHEWKHLPEPYLSDFKNKRKNYRLRLAAILQKGIVKKEIRPVNAIVSVHTILSAINGIEDWQKSGRKVDAKLIEENIIQILIEGLKNK